MLVTNHWVDSFSISIKGVLKNGGPKWVVSFVYGPRDALSSQDFWAELGNVRSCWVGPWCIGGDFNEVREPSK